MTRYCTVLALLAALLVGLALAPARADPPAPTLVAETVRAELVRAQLLLGRDRAGADRALETASTAGVELAARLGAATPAYSPGFLC